MDKPVSSPTKTKQTEPVQTKPLPEKQKQALAARLATLPAEKQVLFRQRLEQEGIDPWQLPIVAAGLENTNSDPEKKPNLEQEPISYPLSFSQQRLWFIDQFNSTPSQTQSAHQESAQTEPANKAMYNLFFALRFGHNINVERFTQAINRIVQKHPILRTRYVEQNGTGRQVINPFTPFDIAVNEQFENSELSEPELLNALDQQMKTEAHVCFDLTHDQRLIRVQLVRLPGSMQGDYLGFFTVHHIAFDAVSNVVFLRELNQFYSNPVENIHQDTLNQNALHQDTLNQNAGSTSVKFHHYAEWQQQWAQSQAFQRQAQYWRQQLNNAPTSLNLATSFKRSAALTHRGAQVSLALPGELSQQIRHLTQQTGSTLYMVMLAAFNLLLSRYAPANIDNNSTDICIGTSVANRSRKELQQALGFFVNTLVMRNQVNPQQSFNDLLQAVKSTAADAFDHQDLPFDKLIELLDIQRQDNLSPLFQVMFVLNNALDDLSLDLGTLTSDTQNNAPSQEPVPVSIFATPLYHARFDLTLRITDGALGAKQKNKESQQSDAIQCELEFNTDLYSPQMANDLLAHYQQLLQHVVRDIHAPMRQIPTLSAVQHQQLLALATSAAPKEQESEQEQAPIYQNQSYHTINEQFEHWANTTPDAIALIAKKRLESTHIAHPKQKVDEQKAIELETFTYRELNQRANQLAQALIERSDDQNHHQPRIGILLERSSAFVISLLAILKTGAAYVPLDTKWPATRIANIIASGELSAVVSDASNNELSAKIPSELLFDINLANNSANTRANESANKIGNITNANTKASDASQRAAYVIYTSGSTGEPKGVVVEHGNVLSYVQGVLQRANLPLTNHPSPTSYGLISTVAADLGNTSLFGGLLTGGSVNIIDADCAADADALADYLQHCAQQPLALDVLKIVPSHWQGLLNAANVSEKAQHLLPKHSLILGGEACSLALVEQVQQLCAQHQSACQIINHYGPTETTVGALAYVHQLPSNQASNNLLSTNLPIGKPLAGYRAYVVDHNQQLCPLGVPGELWIAGAGVARGYMQASDRFIDDPFIKSTNANRRCYRTGDKVRQLPGGDIEFIGRLDQQVKIRGYRVEIGEVEASLHTVPGIQQAAVLVKNNNSNPQLAAFVVLQSDTRVEQIKTALSDGQYLADYMTPQWLLPLEQLPVTANGKLDRKALSEQLQTHIDQNDNQNSDQTHSQNDTQAANQAPSNEKEQILADIWCQVLRLESVGVHDNFFDVGGDSILSLQIISRAKKAGLRLTPKQLFEQKTIAGMASVAKEIAAAKNQTGVKSSNRSAATAKGFTGIGTKAGTQAVGLTPIQHWFFESGFFESGFFESDLSGNDQEQNLEQKNSNAQHHHWNQSVLFAVTASKSNPQPISILFNQLQQAVLALVNHHPALRSRFTQQSTQHNNQWQQTIAATSEDANQWCQHISFSVSDNEGSEDEKPEEENRVLATHIEQVQQSLNITTGPLFKAVLLSNNSGNANNNQNPNSNSHYLFLVAHHLVVDGVSWRILLNDLSALVKHSASKNPNELATLLPEPTSSYAQWVNQLQRYRQQNALSQLDYWCHNEEVNAFPLTNNSFTDSKKTAEANTIANMGTVTRELSPALTQTLLQRVPAVYRTQITDILLTALANQLSQVQQSNHVLIELEGHGREAELAAGSNTGAAADTSTESTLDLSQTCGWFTTRYPVYLSPTQHDASATSSLSDTNISSLKSIASLKNIKEQLRQVPDKGLSFGVLRYLSDCSASQLQQLKQRQQAPVSFNYLGQFGNELSHSKNDINKNESEHLLSLTPYTLKDEHGTPIDRKLDRAAHSKRPFLIDINCAISPSELNTKDTLTIEWHYCTKLHNEQWINQFADDYLQRLTALINAIAPVEMVPVEDEQESTDAAVNSVTKYGANFGVTPSDFPLIQLSQNELDALDFPWHNVASIYPLTPMQEGLLFHTQMNPGTGIYFMQYRYELNGKFNHTAFTQAWQRVVNRHDVLRTAFFRHNHQALQVVYKNVPPPVEILDWRHLTPAQQQTQLPQWMDEQLHTGFDLSQPTQLAITLIRMEDEKYQLIRSFHHILTDAWCFSLIMMDFLHFYHSLADDQGTALSSTNTPAMPPAPRPFQDYVAWLQQQDIAAAERFWRDNLAGFEAPTSLAVNTQTSESGVSDVVVHLSQQQTEFLQHTAQQHNVTLNTLVQAAWGLLVSRYSGDEDIVFGVTVAGRPTDLEGAESIVGLFINTLPLRMNVNAKQSPQDYVQGIFSHNIDIREHEFAPLTDIQRWSDVPAGQPLFNSLFVFENAPIDPEMYQQQALLEVGEMTNRTHTNYPITVVIFPEAELGLQITYDHALFQRDSIDRMLGHFENLLVNLGLSLGQVLKQSNNITASLRDIELLSAAEQQQQLIHWNNTRSEYPREQCWADLFSQQVNTLALSRPNAVAAMCEGQKLSYQNLYQRSLRIAQGLSAQEIGANDIVAILDERGLDLLVMITGVLLSGAAYLPLDPKHPAQRIGNIIELAQPNAVLCAAAMQEKLSSVAANQNVQTPVFTCESLLASHGELTQEQQNALQTQLQKQYHPSNLAYVIYTSGSTGVPKGAMVEQLGMLNNLYSKIPTLGLTERDVIAQTASQCFDISVWQFLTALICGATVQIYPDDIVRHPSALLTAMEEDKVSILEAVPSLIEAFLIDQQHSQHTLTHLRWLMPTGEALSSDLVKRWFAQYPNIPLINAYGPAECADDVSMWAMHSPEDAPQDPVPIGRPTDNNRLYVLDSHQRLQPIGVPGEIYVAGAGVGRGYLNDAERTQAAFMPDLFQENPFQESLFQEHQSQNHTGRLYRTGDLARWRNDGVLEYLGRTDHQVKIRGFRIELGEIEAALIGVKAGAKANEQQSEDAGNAENATVRHVAVLAVNQQLVAYLEISGSEADNKVELLPSDQVAALTQHLRQQLPEYMVPAQFVAVSPMPLNRNGKIDRRALASEPQFAIDFASANFASANNAGQNTQAITHPRTDTEQQLLSLWQQVLQFAPDHSVDIHASFFALGGHSLLAAQLHARVCQQFNIDLPLRTLYERNSISEVGEQVDLLLAASAVLASASVTVPEQEQAQTHTSGSNQSDQDESDLEEFEI